MALLAAALQSACATTYAPALVSGQTARIEVVFTQAVGEDDFLPERIDIDVHDFVNGCPAVKLSMRSKGYRGTIRAQSNQVASFKVPTGRRLAFTVVRSFGNRFDPNTLGVVGAVTHRCFSVVSFVPASEGTYVLRYGPVNRMKPACGATAEKVVSGANGRPAAAPPESIAYPGELEGEAAHQPGGLCALGS